MQLALYPFPSNLITPHNSSPHQHSKLQWYVGESYGTIFLN